MSDIRRLGLPELSASSQLVGVNSVRNLYRFSFGVNQASGALVLIKDDKKDLLKEVRDASHSEPESHIRETAAWISYVLNTDENIRSLKSITGVSDKDASLVDELKKIYPGSSDSIMFRDLHSLEVQEVISSASKTKIIKEEGQHIIIVRHLLEHADSLEHFISGLHQLTIEGSYLFIEVPSAKDLLIDFDISLIWEEHRAYFTIETIKRLLSRPGFRVIATKELVSDGESLVMAVAKVGGLASFSQYHSENITSFNTEAETFIAKFSKVLERLTEEIVRLSKGRDVYIFGANHIAATFVDLVADGPSVVKGFIDDDPRKQCLTLSKYKLPVYTLESVTQERAVVVLVAVKPERAQNLYNRLMKAFPSDEGHEIMPLSDFIVSYTSANE